MTRSHWAILGGILGIVCGEALKLGFTDWAQLVALQYWMGIGVQVASLIAVYTGGLYQDKPQGLDADATALKQLNDSFGKD